MWWSGRANLAATHTRTHTHTRVVKSSFEAQHHSERRSCRITTDARRPSNRKSRRTGGDFKYGDHV